MQWQMAWLNNQDLEGRRLEDKEVWGRGMWMDGCTGGAQSVKILYGVNVISENSPSSHPPPLGAGMQPILPQARGSSMAEIADTH